MEVAALSDFTVSLDVEAGVLLLCMVNDEGVMWIPIAVNEQATLGVTPAGTLEIK